MPNIALEFKYRETKLSRPDVNRIVGTAFNNNKVSPGSGCVIIKCRTAAKTAYQAAQDWKENHNIEVHIDESLSEYDSQYKNN